MMPPVISLRDVIIAHLVLIAIVGLLIYGAAVAVGQEPQAAVEVVPPYAAELFEPIPIRHASGEYVTVRSLPTYEAVPEGQVNRGDTLTVFTAVAGQYLIEVAGMFGVAEIGEIDRVEGNTVSIQREDEQKPKLEIWAYFGDNCQPCAQWKATELPKLAGMADVQVYPIEQRDHDKTRAPAFILRANGKVIERQGYSRGNGWNTAEAMVDFANGE